MMNKSAAEKLGLSPDEECIFLSVEKPMPAPSQTLLEEGKLGFKFDLFTETNSRSMLKYRRSLRFALQLIFLAENEISVLTSRYVHRLFPSFC